MSSSKRESEKIIKIEDIGLSDEEKDFQTLQIELDISDNSNEVNVFKKVRGLLCIYIFNVQ